MFDLMRDVRHAARRLIRTPMFTVATVITLALGIGANTAIFSIVNSVLLKPLPFPEPDRLVGLWQTAPGVNISDLPASIADYVTYREESRTLADVAIWTGNTYTVTGRAEPERVDGISATFRLLPMLGVQPILGRAVAERDDDPGSPEVVMLKSWLLAATVRQRSRRSRAPDHGRRHRPRNHRRSAEGFLAHGRATRSRVAAPLRACEGPSRRIQLPGDRPASSWRQHRGGRRGRRTHDRIALGKFPPPEGMSVKMMEDARLGPKVRPLIDDLLGDVGKSLWVVMATIGIVLLIACANVANLLLVRAEGRAQELAVRAALGAGRGRLAREMLAESLLLGLLGGVVGLGLALAALKLVLSACRPDCRD